MTVDGDDEGGGEKSPLYRDGAVPVVAVAVEGEVELVVEFVDVVFATGVFDLQISE